MKRLHRVGRRAGSRWFFRLSLRARLMIIGVSGVTIVLAAGSVTLYSVLTFAVDRTLDHEATAAAAEVAALIDGGHAPDPLPISGAQVVQVIDARYRVIDGSVGADRLTPLLHPDELRRALAGATVTVSGDRAALSGPLRVTARSAGPGDSPVSVIVALQVSDVTHSLDIVRTALLISSPTLLALLALIAWYVIGWTLRPVEALRQGAERISGANRSERLPVPESADEIAALAVTLNQMLDRLAASRNRQRAFVADAAHELRNPLTSIRIQLDVADRVGDHSHLAEELRTDVDRLTALVEDLLLLARSDADSRGPGRPTTFDGRSLLREIAGTTGSSSIAVQVTEGGEVAVHADRDEMRRAVSNLLDNAVRHAHRSVELSVTEQPTSFTFHVTDDGPGIASEDRDRVFDRFTRLDDARDQDSGGSGLGLPIVRELAHRAGGTITLHTATDDTDHPGLRAQLDIPRRV